jgi:hypothetical protein
VTLRLRVVVAALGVLLGACQANPIAIVDCRTIADCGAGATCDDSHRCVESPGFAGSPGIAGSPGAAGSPTVTPYVATPLAWSAIGAIDVLSNPFSIHGAWERYDDCPNVDEAIAQGNFVCPPQPPTPGCCTVWDASLGGPRGEAGIEVTGATDGASGRICARGLIASVLNDASGSPAYPAQWGASLELPLNDGLPFDATRAFPGGPIAGFALDLDGPPSEALLWVGIGTSYMSPGGYGTEVLIPAGRVTLLVDQISAPEWATDALPFDASNLAALVVHPRPVVGKTLPFDFCVSNLVVLQRGNAE